eukprot:TRINITY_DN2717_c0_g1_i1.p1 TRINITY_DN2717_c0_g1~~TRINITY_DN2717_c0_g1_i1.p1  ORF type:complete len:338 (-),score=110.96 TRINITY_DN2717_c0_g1_i1:67-990(-)
MYGHKQGLINLKGCTTVMGLLPPLKGALGLERFFRTAGIDGIEIHKGDPGDGFIHHFYHADWWAKLGADILNAADWMELKKLSSDQEKAIADAPHDAVQYLLQASKSDNAKNTSLLCLGPLTNIARALEIDKDMLKRFKEVVLMGGNLSANGNTPNKVSEWNYYCDPEAVKIFLSNLEGVDVFMCGLEIANEHVVSREDQLLLLELSDKPAVNPQDESIGHLLKKMLKKTSYACTYDPVAAAWLLRRDMHRFEKKRLGIITDTKDNLEAQMFQVEMDSQVEGTGVVYLGSELDRPSYYRFLEEVITG